VSLPSPPTAAPIGLPAPSGPDPVAALRAALGAARAAGAVAARGPLAGTTWEPYRANLGPFDEPPFPGEPTFDPAPWEAVGATVEARYTTTRVAHADAIANGARAEAAVAAEGLRIVGLDAVGGYAAALEAVHPLVQHAFADALAFTPLPRAAFLARLLPLAPLLDPALPRLALDAHGTPVGFCLAFPCHGPRQRLVVKTLAVGPAHRRLGLGAALVGAVHRAGAAAGLRHGLHALMALSSHSQRITAHGGAVVRRYALYRVDFGAPVAAP